MTSKYTVDSQFQKIVDSYNWTQKDTPPYYWRRYVGPGSQCIHQIVCQLLGLTIPEYFVIDHINGDVNLNTADNLRIVTKSINALNSQSKGYYFNKNLNKYHCRIKVNYNQIDLGCHVTEQKAQEVVKSARSKYFAQTLKESNILLRSALQEMGEDPERPFLLLNQESLNTVEV